MNETRKEVASKVALDIRNKMGTRPPESLSSTMLLLLAEYVEYLEANQKKPPSLWVRFKEACGRLKDTLLQ